MTFPRIIDQPTKRKQKEEKCKAGKDLTSPFNLQEEDHKIVGE
jgi:hypothetical protein